MDTLATHASIADSGENSLEYSMHANATSDVPCLTQSPTWLLNTGTHQQYFQIRSIKSRSLVRSLNNPFTLLFGSRLGRTAVYQDQG